MSPCRERAMSPSVMSDSNTNSASSASTRANEDVRRLSASRMRRAVTLSGSCALWNRGDSAVRIFIRASPLRACEVTRSSMVQWSARSSGVGAWTAIFIFNRAGPRRALRAERRTRRRDGRTKARPSGGSGGARRRREGRDARGTRTRSAVAVGRRARRCGDGCLGCDEGSNCTPKKSLRSKKKCNGRVCYDGNCGLNSMYVPVQIQGTLRVRASHFYDGVPRFTRFRCHTRRRAWRPPRRRSGRRRVRRRRRRRRHRISRRATRAARPRPGRDPVARRASRVGGRHALLAPPAMATPPPGRSSSSARWRRT